MAVAGFAQGVTNSNYWSAHLNSMKPQTQSAATASTDTGKPLITTGADGKSFFDNLLDIVNPLEHLPVVSTIYSTITGDKPGDVEKIAGDTLYGGVIGLASSVADVAFEKITGKSFGDTMLSMVGLDGKDGDANTALAANTSGKTANDAEVAQTAALNKSALTPSATVPGATALMPTPAAKLAQLAAMPSLVTTVNPILVPDQTQVSAAPAKTAAAAVDISPQTDALLQSLQRNGISGDMQTQALDAYRRTMSMNSAAANRPPAQLH
jgi:hypothetical protein